MKLVGQMEFEDPVKQVSVDEGDEPDLVKAVKAGYKKPIAMCQELLQQEDSEVTKSGKVINRVHCTKISVKRHSSTGKQDACCQP